MCFPGGEGDSFLLFSRPKKLLIRIAGNAGENRAEKDCIKTGIGKINLSALLHFQLQVRIQASAAPDESFREINSAETGVS